MLPPSVILNEVQSLGRLILIFGGVVLAIVILFVMITHPHPGKIPMAPCPPAECRLTPHAPHGPTTVAP